MKKVVFISVTIILILFVGFSMFSQSDYYHNFADSVKWKQLRDGFDWDKINNVEITGFQIELNESEKLELVNSLSRASFYRSNWRKEGPTGTVITVSFKSGNIQHFQYWGGNIFETSYKGGQFLIKSDEMKKIMNKYGIKE